jgi:hypothetical protein
MAFDDTYRESIQSKHIANVGFTSTAKGITNEGFGLENPHQIIASQIPATDVVGTYGPLTASGIAAGLVQEHSLITLTEDTTVNNKKAWYAEVGGERVTRMMRYAGTQYKLRLYANDGTTEILPSETNFNWEYDASVGVVYFDSDPSAHYTTPLKATFYTYIGDTVADGLGTVSSGITNHTHDDRYYTESEIDGFFSALDYYTTGQVDSALQAQDEFIELLDTPSSYTATNMLYMTASGIAKTGNLTWNDTTNTLTVTGDVSVTGTFGFDTGTSVNEIVTSMGGSSTDDQLPTAKAVYDAIEAKPNDFLGLTDTISSYNVDRVLFTSSSGVIDNANFTFTPATSLLTVTDILTEHAEVDNNDGDTWVWNASTIQSATRVSSKTTNLSRIANGTYTTASGGGAAYGGIYDSSYGFQSSTGLWAIGYGSPYNYGVLAWNGGDSSFVPDDSENYAVYAWSNNGASDVSSLYGVYGRAEVILGSSDVGYGVYGMSTGSDINWAAYFADGNVMIENDLTVSGTLGLASGTTVNEIVTSVDSSSTDDQLPTAKSVYDEIAAVSGTIDDGLIWEIVDTPGVQIRPKVEHQGKAIYTAGNLTIGGDLTVSGTTTTVHSEELTVADKIITVNADEAGAGVTGSQYAGIEVDRGSETNYMFVFDEVQDNFRVGISGSLQAVATREDVPNDGYVAVWDAGDVRFNTTVALSDLATDAEVTTVSGVLQDQIDQNASDISTHGHVEADISDLDKYTTTEVDNLLAAQDEFIELTDTPSAYTADRILFTSASGVEFSDADLTFDGDTLTAADVSVTNTFTLGGTSVSGIVTDLDDSVTDGQLPSAAAVWEEISTVASGVPEYFMVNCTYDTGVWKYNGGFSELPTNMQVYYNGVLNRDGDTEYYSAAINSGTLEITFGFTTHSDDWVAVIYGDTAAGAGPRNATWVTKTGAYTALKDDRIMVDTSSVTSFTITLPATPAVGDEVTFLDAGGNCGSVKVVIGRNGSNIMGLAQDLDMDQDDASFKLVYYNASRGWVIA